MDMGIKEHKALRARTDLVQNHFPLLRNNLVTNNREARQVLEDMFFQSLRSLDEESQQ